MKKKKLKPAAAQLGEKVLQNERDLFVDGFMINVSYFKNISSSMFMMIVV